MFKKCRYIISAANKTQYPNRGNLPEILLLGRSNVGKSSLINALCGRKALAHISTRPGKTRLLNFYFIDEAFYLVDAPGYGYARRSRAERLDYGCLLDEYLIGNMNLRAVLLLVDAKVGPTEDDLLVFDYLKHYGIKTIIVATKQDKIGKTLRLRHRRLIVDRLGLAEEELFLTSAREKTGLDELKDAIARLIK